MRAAIEFRTSTVLASSDQPRSPRNGWPTIRAAAQPLGLHRQLSRDSVGSDHATTTPDRSTELSKLAPRFSVNTPPLEPHCLNAATSLIGMILNWNGSVPATIVGPFRDTPPHDLTEPSRSPLLSLQSRRTLPCKVFQPSGFCECPLEHRAPIHCYRGSIRRLSCTARTTRVSPLTPDSCPLTSFRLVASSSSNWRAR